ncbi:MAG: methyltransferase domain-containing protein [Wenzhouxiangella sp.]|jgi:tRNA G46 methylase TrmB|nr:methyltransferase domain-containing protein [Wenzhouxiangella sp.]
MDKSRKPCSSQQGVHARLEETVRRHLAKPWRQPLRAFSRPAFETLGDCSHRKIVLDAGCGTGHSTALLGQRFPDCMVLGVDRSASRLGRSGSLPGNVSLLRADLADFWRLAKEAGWALQHHFLLYPNPWPKPAHLKRRWHAHPVWPDVLALGGTLELRTNFAIYAEEFALALELAGYRAHLQVLSLPAETGISPFETKYLQSRHTLFCVRADLH